MIDKLCLVCSVGMDYNHGTGHGVGAYLAVHEGPVGVGRDNSVLQVGPTELGPGKNFL